jgi:hypothetical protein
MRTATCNKEHVRAALEFDAYYTHNSLNHSGKLVEDMWDDCLPKNCRITVEHNFPVDMFARGTELVI